MAKKMMSVEGSGFRQRTHDRVDKVMDKAESVQERGRELRENADGYIRQNPEKSVLIAAGVGAVLGAVVVAMMMRHKE